jgi:SAM-dependent methyltransferase
MRGWLPLYRTSVGVGARYLLRHGYLREALIRVVIPLDPSRYLELPWALERLGARSGERVLDLASPKLLALALARRGARVTSVDLFEPEIDAWRKLVRADPNLTLRVADGRALPFEAATFDHAYSISVLEHVADAGDEAALRELARVTKPGGRVLITLPHARQARDEHRARPAYGGTGTFFQRWYDDNRLTALLDAVPELRVREHEIVRLQPNWNDLYARYFPWLVALGPLYGLLARERRDEDGDVVRLVLERQ